MLWLHSLLTRDRNTTHTDFVEVLSSCGPAGLWAFPVDAHLLADELTQKTGDKGIDAIAMETPADNDLTKNMIREEYQ